MILDTMSYQCKSQIDDYWSDEEQEPQWDLVQAEAFSHFTGTSVMRNTCVVQLDAQGPIALSALLSSPLMHAMSQLTAFKTVQLRFSSLGMFWLKSGPFATPDNISTQVHRHGTCLGFDTTVLQISSALEPTLGSFTVKGGIDGSGGWYQDVKFRRQDRLTQKLDKLGIDFSAPTGE